MYPLCSVFVAYIGLCRPQPTVWGEKLPFNTICGEYASASGGWVHGVAFSPSGDALAFASTYFPEMYLISILNIK